MFCRLRQCRQILPKLNLSAILLLFLIKRAALGNLKVNFHCAHWHRFFPLKKGLSKTHQSSLTLKFFLKSPRPSLPLKRAPPLSPSPFSHGEGWLHSAIWKRTFIALICTTFPLRGQGMCQPPYSVLKPLRYKVGGPSEVYASSGAAVFYAGMNPPCGRAWVKNDSNRWYKWR